MSQRWKRVALLIASLFAASLVLAFAVALLHLPAIAAGMITLVMGIVLAVLLIKIIVATPGMPLQGSAASYDTRNHARQRQARIIGIALCIIGIAFLLVAVMNSLLAIGNIRPTLLAANIIVKAILIVALISTVSRASKSLRTP